MELKDLKAVDPTYQGGHCYYYKDDVEDLFEEKEEQHKHEVSLLLVRLAEKDKKIAALTAKYKDCKRELDLLKDTQAFYRGK